MNVLGICHDVLICSAALVRDGKVVSAIPEERLDRVKQSRVFPSLAIQKCLEMGGLTLSDIDEIAVAWNPGIELETIPRDTCPHAAGAPSTSRRCQAGSCSSSARTRR